MKKLLLFLLLLPCVYTYAGADSVFVKIPQIPILIDRTDNILLELRIDAKKGDILNQLALQFEDEAALSSIRALRLYYAGTEATSREGTHWRPVDYVNAFDPQWTRKANPAYSVLQQEITAIKPSLSFQSEQPMVSGVNYVWVSIEMKPGTDLLTTLALRVKSAEINRLPAVLIQEGTEQTRRMGMGVRHAGS